MELGSHVKGIFSCAANMGEKKMTKPRKFSILQSYVVNSTSERRLVSTFQAIYGLMEAGLLHFYNKQKL